MDNQLNKLGKSISETSKAVDDLIKRNEELLQAKEINRSIIKTQAAMILEKLAYLKASKFENEIKAEAIRELQRENKILKSLLFWEGKRQ